MIDILIAILSVCVFYLALEITKLKRDVIYLEANRKLTMVLIQQIQESVRNEYAE